MTLQEAVATLNLHRHGGHDRWEVWDDHAVGPHHHDDLFSAFEAIAIAEKYRREAAKQAQEAASSPRLCQSCRHYRTKVWEDDSDDPAKESGKCDSRDLHAQVQVSGVNFAVSLGMDVERLPELEEWVGIRVRGDFGCRHWEARKVKNDP